jgi:hypothetical protein
MVSWNFLGRRAVSLVMHCVLPGSGFLIDAYDLADTVNNALDAGEITPEDAIGILDSLKGMRENEQDFHLPNGKTVCISKHHCSKCHKVGHNKRTCGRR